jgi:hypothetical protein
MLILFLSTIGTLSSLFLGVYAVRVLVFQGAEPHFPSKPRWQWWLFQFWFNFVCSIAGWAIAILYVRRYQSDALKFAFTGADAIPLLMALLGVTGLLPRALWAFSELAGDLSKKLTG